MASHLLLLAGFVVAYTLRVIESMVKKDFFIVNTYAIYGRPCFTAFLDSDEHCENQFLISNTEARKIISQITVYRLNCC